MGSGAASAIGTDQATLILLPRQKNVRARMNSALLESRGDTGCDRHKADTNRGTEQRQPGRRAGSVCSTIGCKCNHKSLLEDDSSIVGG